MELREGDVVNESPLARGSTMHMSTIDAYGIASPSEKVPLVRIVKAIPMERLRWLVMGVIVLATGVIFLTGGANPTSTVEMLLLWSLVLLAI
jgi:hypothetical protein